MKYGDFIYSIVTGDKRLRIFMTPVGLLVFISILLLVIYGSLYTDRVFDMPKMIPESMGKLIGALLLIPGFVFWGWSIVSFIKAKGTPVPFNPPRELVITGPYALSRNPMLTGVFFFLFGIGFLLRSISMVFIWTPLFIILNVLELKFIEEPELERRFGTRYTEYRNRVSMFFPRIRIKG